jgi:type II secretory pathway component PulJ
MEGMGTVFAAFRLKKGIFYRSKDLRGATRALMHGAFRDLQEHRGLIASRFLYVGFLSAR